MNSVTVDKYSLSGVVQKNRDAHKEAFEEAIVAFREKTADELREASIRVREGDLSETYFSYSPPEDHTADYDRVIEMLNYEVNDEVRLSATEFSQYVQDEWHWKSQFADAYTVNTGKFLSQMRRD